MQYITLDNRLLEICSSRRLAAVHEGRKYTFFCMFTGIS